MHESLRNSLRTQLRAARTAIDVASRIDAAQNVARLLQSIPAYRDAQRVAGYWAVRGELPLSSVVPALERAVGVEFFLPRMVGGASESTTPCLQFLRWRTGDPVAANRFGIPEPAGAGVVPVEEIDVVLLPLIGFDRAGGRLGAGGGYYDRTFAFRQTTQAPPLLIGIAFACQEIAALEAEPWDVDLDWVVTENEVIECGGRRH